MRIPDDVIESLDQNGIDVSSAWLRCDVDVYNELYGSPLVQPVSLEAATLNELRFLDAAGTLTIRMTDSANSLVIYSSYVEFVEDGTGGSDGQTVAVDDVTIDWNNASQLEVKDAGITADKLAPGAVTNAKFADAPASTLKGRARGAGSGPVSDLTGTSVRPIVGDGWAGGQALVSDAIAGLVESVTTATEISYVHGVTSPIQTQLSSQSVHNNLSGLQGGVSGEYYHLTAAQATTVGALTGWATKAYTNGSTTDVAEGTNLYFTNARADARITAQKGVASGLATLDVGGKVPLSQLPATTIVETFVVASQAAMLALAAQQGDVCVRTDLSKTYILKTDPASTLANWQELLSPVDGVQSVGLSATGPLSVSGSPITNSGTLALAWNGSSANLVRADGSTVATSSYLSAAGNPDLVAIEALAGTSGFLKKTAANTWALDTNTYLTGNQSITLSGDVSGTGATAITTTLASIVTAASNVGSSTVVPVISYDAKGRITGTSTASIAFPVTSVFGRTGAVVAASGDYNTAQVTENASYLYFTEARVRGSALTGYTVGANTALAGTDTILVAFGKIQGQLNAKQATLTNPVTGTGTAGQIARWTASGVIDGGTDLTYDGTYLSSPGAKFSQLTDGQMVHAGPNGILRSDTGLVYVRQSNVTREIVLGNGTLATAPYFSVRASSGQPSGFRVKRPDETLHWALSRSAAGSAFQLINYDATSTLLDAPVTVYDGAGGVIEFGGTGTTKRDANFTGNLQVGGSQFLSSGKALNVASALVTALAHGSSGSYLPVASDYMGNVSYRTAAQARSDIGAQPLDSDLTAIAALTTTTFGRSLLTQADAAAARALIGAQAALTNPVVGTGVANRLAYWSSAGSIAESSIVFGPANGSLTLSGASAAAYVNNGSFVSAALSDGALSLRNVNGGKFSRLRVTGDGELTIDTSVDLAPATLVVKGAMKIGFNQVIGDRKTGWAAATGTATRTTFATSTVTLPQLAERVKALLDDLISHGLIGA